MNFDTVLLAAVCDELNDVIVHARVDKVTQPSPGELVLLVYNGVARHSLLISTDANASRIHLSKRRSRPSPMTAPAFCMLLRKYLEGAVIDSVDQPFGFSERVLLVTFRSSRETTKLWVEVMGRQSNIVLTNDSGVILGAIKRVTLEMSRFREIRTGIAYSPPPRQSGSKRDPTEPLASFGLPTEPFANNDDAEKWLVATFRGTGTLLARESVLRSDAQPLTGESVWYGLNQILSAIRLKEYSPIVYHDLQGVIEGAYPLPLRSVPEAQQRSVSSISEALEAAYGSQLEEDVLEKERAALLAALRRAAKSNEHQLIDVREGLLNCEQADYLRESGELLLANIGRSSEADEIVVDDYFSEVSDARRTIKLDPSMTIHENAERYFRKYQKARDSKDFLERRQTELTASAFEIELGLIEASSAETVHQIQELIEQLGTHRTQSQPGKGTAAAKPLYDGHKIKSLKTPDGWEILVGENSTSNDFLTTKVASPSDIWLHARAVPSAHAVIRSQNRPASVSTAAILLAAEQVAKRSQAKHAGLVSVDYTLKKYVRKPRGSAPGQVTYTNEKTVDVIAEGP